MKVASEEIYKAQAEQDGAAGGLEAGPSGDGQQGVDSSKQGDDVEDVDFEEVK